ncbi:O-antigen ligase [mine drainage metagenome]|uniref:O-antigen ligase n=1 Tax=mine drainage metagenome TaxID=410659 RepID=A0A1J5PEK1_9ZZZZ
MTGYPYRTFLYIFYVSGGETNNVLMRNIGLCWEPGVLQLILNLFLFFSIKRGRSILFLALVALTVVSTFSTAGYIIMILNIIYFVLLQLRRKINISLLIFMGLIFSTGLFALIQQNISAKFDSTNTSGLARLRDYEIGIELISEKPILGHGIFDQKYLLSKTALINIESNIFSKGYLSDYGNFSGGYTDGLLGLACWYGVPIAIYIYILTYKNKFVSDKWYEKLIMFLILCLACISEPITYTSLFLLFPFSVLVFNRNSAKSNKKKNNVFLMAQRKVIESSMNNFNV